MNMFGSEIKAFWAADWDVLVGHPVYIDEGGIFSGDVEISDEMVEIDKKYDVDGVLISHANNEFVCSVATLVKKWRLSCTTASVVLRVDKEQVADVLAVARERGWKVEK